MTKGLAKRLLVSTPYRNDASHELVLVSCDTQTVSSLPFSDLTPTDWGFVYERHVGIYYETMGYSVDYRGFRLGLFDSGIDLVAAKTDMPTCYVQCKATQKKFGKQAIETILFKGGNFISKECFSLCRSGGGITVNNNGIFSRVLAVAISFFL